MLAFRMWAFKVYQCEVLQFNSINKLLTIPLVDFMAKNNFYCKNYNLKLFSIVTDLKFNRAN